MSRFTTDDMINAAHRVRASYQEFHDRLAKRHGIANEAVQAFTRDISAIDLLLEHNADFFEFLAGALERELDRKD